MIKKFEVFVKMFNVLRFSKTLIDIKNIDAQLLDISYGELRLFPIEIDIILDKIVKAGK